MKEFVEALWLMSIQASILILVVLLIRFALRNYKKIYSYCLWLLVLVRLLCPVFIESDWSLQPNVQIDLEAEAVVQNQNIAQEDNLAANDAMQPTAPIINADKADNVTNNNESTSEIKRDNRNIIFYLQVIYLVGMTGFTIYFLVQYFVMKKRVAFAIRDKENIWLCEQIDSPFVMGVIKPRIYLPFHISDNEKRYILRHEQAHITHMDPLVRMLGSAALILHWWNPLVWYAIHKMNQDMEMFCDETALSNAPIAERKAYSKALLHFSMKQSGLAVTLSFGESNTEVRIKNVLRKKRNSIIIGTLVLIVGIFCVVAFLTIPKESDNEKNQVGTEETEVAEVTEDTSQLQETNQTVDQTVMLEMNLFGNWMVNHIAGNTSVTALSEEEQRSFIEARIGYEEASYTYYKNREYFSERADIVGYKSELVTKEEFAEMFPGTTFDDLAVAADEMQYVTVEFEDDNSRFGDNFFVFDEIDIIVQYNGVFFWMQKIDDLGIEMNEGQYYYELTTGFRKETVEAYASEIRSQILEGDWVGISEKIVYPITIAGNTYQNAEEFLEEDMDRVVTKEFIQAIEEETCEEMFHNWQGIMMGETGQIWFAEVLNYNSEPNSLKIIGINIPEPENNSVDNNTNMFEAEPWYSAYQTILDDWTTIDQYGDFAYLKMYFDSDYQFDNYWLCDIDSNGVPELLLHSDYMNITAAFTYYDNQIYFLTYDVIYGINKETGEIVVEGHWHGAGGSGVDEWTAYQVTDNTVAYSMYIDSYRSFEDVEMEKPYEIYNPVTGEYERQASGEEYDKLYTIHVTPCILKSEYQRYTLNDLSGLDIIQ